MNVFVLCTGRCGSTTFYRACSHITNFTAAHESRVTLLGPERLAYPANHIEVDNRLSWLLGRLDRTYGDSAFYVHLTRDREAVAESFMRRYEKGIIKAYRDGILMRESRRKLPAPKPLDLCFDYIDSVTANIEYFLNDKSNKMSLALERASDEFRSFWDSIGAEGDFSAALKEWNILHNATQRYNTWGFNLGGGSVINT